MRAQDYQLVRSGFRLFNIQSGGASRRDESRFTPCNRDASGPGGASPRAPQRYSGKTREYFTCPSEKLLSMEATPSTCVSLSRRNCS